MNRLTRLYNQNRRIVIGCIIVIALILIVIQTLNSIAIQKEEKSKANLKNTFNINNVQNQEIKQGETSTIRIFYINRLYSLENWYSTVSHDTYYVKYTEDVLATGTTNSKDNLSDYITVEKGSNGNLLNINGFARCQIAGRSKTSNGVTIRVNKLYEYMDYTIANITVTNNSKNTICIDSREDIDKTYLYDTNNVTYTAFLNENTDEELVVRSGIETNVNIKLNKLYNPTSRTIIGMEFKDVVLNYDSYIQGIEKKNKVTLDVEI